MLFIKEIFLPLHPDLIAYLNKAVESDIVIEEPDKVKQYRFLRWEVVEKAHRCFKYRLINIFLNFFVKVIARVILICTFAPPKNRGL